MNPVHLLLALGAEGNHGAIARGRPPTVIRLGDGKAQRVLFGTPDDKGAVFPVPRGSQLRKKRVIEFTGFHKIVGAEHDMAKHRWRVSLTGPP